jgi:hypothetical protein
VGVGSSVLLRVILGPFQGPPGLACHVPVGRVLSRSVAVTIAPARDPWINGVDCREGCFLIDKLCSPKESGCHLVSASARDFKSPRSLSSLGRHWHRAVFGFVRLRQAFVLGLLGAFDTISAV